MVTNDPNALNHLIEHLVLIRDKVNLLIGEVAVQGPLMEVHALLSSAIAEASELPVDQGVGRGE
jgi:hypothetical protein